MPISQEIQAETQQAERWAAIAKKHRVRINELEDAVEEAEAAIRRKRDIRQRLEEEPDFRANWSEEHREARREELADQIDGLIASRDHLLDRLDRVADEVGEAHRHAQSHRAEIERLRERRAAMQRAEGRLTPHFHIAEFACNDGTPVPDAAVQALIDTCRRYLEPLRAKFGVVHVTSGYRTQGYNASVGGASNSIHVYDLHPGAAAVDHWAEGASPASVQAWHEANTNPGGLGRYATFTHVDNRTRIGWAVSRWSG